MARWLTIFSALLGTLTCPPTRSAARSITYQTLLTTGQSVPGVPDATVSRIAFTIGLSDRGEVGFSAQMGGPGVTTQSDDFSGVAGLTGLQFLQREGAAIPNMPGFVYGPGAGTPLVGPTGFVTHTFAQTELGTRKSTTGHYAGPMGSPSLVILVGGAAPSIPGARIQYGGLSIPNAVNRSYLQTTLVGQGVTNANDLAEYRCDPSGNLSLAFREGQSIPGVNANASSPRATSMNLGGEILVDANFPSVYGGNAIFKTSPTGPVLIAASSLPVPNFPGQIWTYLDSRSLLADGRVAFTGTFKYPSALDDSRALFLTDQAGVPSVRILAGAPIPGLPGYRYGSFYFDALHVTDSELIAGHGVVLIGTSGGGSAFYFGDIDHALPLAIEGTPAPGTNAVFGGYDSADQAISPQVSEHGFMIFRTLLTGPGVTMANDRAVWGANSSGQLYLLAREGDPFDVGGGALKTINQVVGFQGDPDLAVNDAGQFVFRLSFTDGTSGLFMATVPEPELSSCLPVLFGLLASGLQRRSAFPMSARR